MTKTNMVRIGDRMYLEAKKIIEEAQMLGFSMTVEQAYEKAVLKKYKDKEINIPGWWNFK